MQYGRCSHIQVECKVQRIESELESRGSGRSDWVVGWSEVNHHHVAAVEQAVATTTGLGSCSSPSMERLDGHDCGRSSNIE